MFKGAARELAQSLNLLNSQNKNIQYTLETNNTTNVLDLTIKKQTVLWILIVLGDPLLRIL